MSQITVDNIVNSNGLERFACLAFVNFNGTGTVAIRASGNVSSITDNGKGDYTVNFTTAMPDANYSVAPASGQSVNTFVSQEVVTQAVGSVRIRLRDWNNGSGTNASLNDAAFCSVAIFR